MTASAPSVAVLIVAAGTGERFGGALPKQYLPLLGKPVLRWSIDAFKSHPAVSAILTVIHQDHADLYRRAAGDAQILAPVTGGATRQESVLRGLEVLAAQKPDIVLIHDAARPAVTHDVINAVIAALSSVKAAVPGLAVVDTLRRENRTESREGLYAVQTPQGFRFADILDLHRKHAGKAATDDAGLFDAAGIPVAIVAGDRGNFKITHADDLAQMEQTLSSRCGDVRTGSGYDVHRLVVNPSRKLMIGGVEIPHTHTLEGHSDADVALHALTDALLATVCDGDIGMHFSPKDARWKNADSAAFLRHAADKIAVMGGIITHADVTIICEEPKIGPHRDNIRARIAEILALPPSRISVKATTTEGLGFTGRKEGIAAEAVATVRLPFAPHARVIAEDEVRKWGT